MSIRTFIRRLLPGRRGDEAPDPTSALELSRARFERIVEIAADAIISIDEDGGIILFNRGAEEIFGYDRDEVLGEPLDMLLPERFRRTHSTHMARFAEGPEAARHMGMRREIAGLRKDGREFPAEASISRLDAPGGRVLTVVLRDVTEQKRAEHTQRFLANASAVLARSLDYETTLAGLARLALPHLADWCIIDLIDGDGLTRIQVAHRDPELDEIAQELKSYPPVPARPHPSLTVLETGEHELLETVSDAFLRGVAADARHLALLRRLGVGSLLVVPLVARDRTLGAFALVSADARRPFAPDDVLLAEELGRRAALAVDNARLYREARDAVAARDEVLGVVSHDLGNPLSAIRVAARVLDRCLEPEQIGPARDQVDAIREASGQMERLIRDLLEIRRIESGRLRLVRRPERVAELVENAARSMKGVAEEQDVALERDLADGLPELIQVDADRVQQIFSNFMGNALRFTPAGGTVTLGAEPADDRVRFWIRDTGPGLSTDELPHVFDRFWQAKQQGSPGVGLGLAIARGLAEAHGGSVRVESEEGRGCTFFFELPVDGAEGWRAPASAGESTATPLHLAAENAQSLWKPAMPKNITILLADDHGVLRAGLKALLDAEPDLQVVGEADTGEDAIAKVKELEPDIVVMDLSMPGMGGMEATRRIAAMDSGTKVLVLTMHAEEEFLLPVLDAGGSGFVRKTSADEDLTHAIRTVARDEVFLYPSAAKLLLERYKDADADEMRGPLSKLTERERDVLAMTAEGFSSSEIGEKLFISPKTVDTYRSRIMDKLQLRHRSELVRFALQTGLLRAEQ